MRQIPLVGNFVNWLSPLANKDPIGRSLNLQSGKVETTEIIYKSHIQKDDELNNSQATNPSPECVENAINENEVADISLDATMSTLSINSTHMSEEDSIGDVKATDKDPQ